MTECREVRISEYQSQLGAKSWGTVAQAIEAFVNAARADDMLGVFVGRTPCKRTFLKLYTYRSSVGVKMVELPPAAANPTKVRRWLETNGPHISPVFSPLKERGPPRT